ncbi:hypothetical protein QJS66_09135 [Kocuria rhizophila]|nr:hypothetical protein QJS66_09135 [Kocuria rhizophila]
MRYDGPGIDDRRQRVFERLTGRTPPGPVRPGHRAGLSDRGRGRLEAARRHGPPGADGTAEELRSPCGSADGPVDSRGSDSGRPSPGLASRGPPPQRYLQPAPAGHRHLFPRRKASWLTSRWTATPLPPSPEQAHRHIERLSAEVNGITATSPRICRARTGTASASFQEALSSWRSAQAQMEQAVAQINQALATPNADAETEAANARTLSS